MENQNSNCERLMIENQELKRALALSLNQPLIQKLKAALDRINSGDYVSEEEFFKS